MSKDYTAVSDRNGRERQVRDRSFAVPLLLATLTLTPLPASAREETPRTPAPVTEGELPSSAPGKVDAQGLVPWQIFGQYVAAYVWVSDSDFDNNTIRALQVCGRDPKKDTGLTKIDDFDQSLANSAWLVVALNHTKFMQVGQGRLKQIIQSDDYARLDGQARLDFARENLTAGISRDREVHTLVKKELQRLREISSVLAGAGFQPADPAQLLTSKARQGLQLLRDNWDQIVVAREKRKIPSDLKTPTEFNEAVVEFLRSTHAVNDKGADEALKNLQFLAERGAPRALQLSSSK